jgi:hypothetical protein
MDESTEFAVRYYRWASEQWLLEIDHEFPLLSTVHDSSCPGFLRIMRTMSRDERLEMARIQMKHFHPKAVAAFGETFSPEEKRMFDEWRRIRAESRASESGWDDLKPRKKPIARLRAAIKEAVTPILGNELKEYGQGYYELAIGRWVVLTVIDFSSRLDDFTYHHQIRRATDRVPISMSSSISVAKWFGIAGATSWDGLSEEDIPDAIATLAKVCRRFLDAAPNLLPE